MPAILSNSIRMRSAYVTMVIPEDNNGFFQIMVVAQDAQRRRGQDEQARVAYR
jgi:hypothetical protein